MKRYLANVGEKCPTALSTQKKKFFLFFPFSGMVFGHQAMHYLLSAICLVIKKLDN